jgi:deoxyribonuclease-2
MRFSSLAVLSLLSGTAGQCLNEAGDPVPYWALFKFPHGSSYLYYDPVTGPVASSFSLNASEPTFGGAMVHTLSQLWSEGWQYAMYNDEPPAQTTYNFTVGHSKGVWLWKGSEAAWLQHSFPKFPEGPMESPEGFPGIPSNIWEYGQHAVCVSMNRTYLSTIVKEWSLVIPQLYETNYPSDGSFPGLEELLNGQWSEEPICTPFKVYGSTPFLTFAKSTQWNNELYASCMAPTLGSNLLVESWLHSDAEGPYCQPTYKYDIGDVNALRFPNGVTFSNWEDHSKWAISLEGDWVCFSDINRATSQYQRGGGAICLNDKELHGVVQSIVTETNSCG